MPEYLGDGCLGEGLEALLARVLAQGQTEPPEPARPKRNRSGEYREGQALTPREREVTALLLKGYGKKQIGHHLGIGEGTVRTWATRIYRKLGINSQAELQARRIAVLEESIRQLCRSALGQ